MIVCTTAAYTINCKKPWKNTVGTSTVVRNGPLTWSNSSTMYHTSSPNQSSTATQKQPFY